MHARRSLLLTLLPLSLAACKAPPRATDTTAATAPPLATVESRGMPVDLCVLVREHVLPLREERGPELGGVAPIAPRAHEVEAATPWSDRCPADGLILTVVARALPVELAEGSPRSSLCLLDRVWCTRDEARALVPSEPRVGEVYALPAGFAERLARFNFLDREGDAGAAFEAAEVESAELRGEVLSLHDSVVRIGITGELVTADEERRVVSDVRGTAAFDFMLASFSSFELVADAKCASSATKDRQRRVGFVLTLSRSPRPEVVPPRFIERYEPYAVAAGS